MDFDLIKCGECSRNAGRGYVSPVGDMGKSLMMLVLSEPFKEDLATKRHFTGKMGRELEQFLVRSSLKLSQFYITSLLKCTGTTVIKGDVGLCRRHLEAEIETMKPRVIVAMGALAAQTLLDTKKNIEDLEGLVFGYKVNGSGVKIPLIPCYSVAFASTHPTAALSLHRAFSTANSVFSTAHELREVEQPQSLSTYNHMDTDSEHCLELDECGVVAVDTETVEGKLWCVSWATGTTTGHVAMATETGVLGELARYLKRRTTTTILHNSLFDLPVLAQVGIIPSNVYDTMIAAYILGDEPQGLKSLAYRLCGIEMVDYKETVQSGGGDKRALEYVGKIAGKKWADPSPRAERQPTGEYKLKKPQNIQKKALGALKRYFDKGSDLFDWWKKIEKEERGLVEELLGELMPPSLMDVPRHDAIHYSALDAVATLRVYNALKWKIEKRKQGDILAIDQGTIPMIADMQDNGCLLDLEFLRTRSRELGREMKRLEKEISELTGRYINPNSSVQVAHALCVAGVFQSSNQSTSESALRAIEGDYPVLQAVLDYRSVSKLKGTYADALPLLVDGDNRVHTGFKPTRTATGRLSSADPNLQNIPNGGKIRNAFIATPGNVLLSVDYSQIELRVGAHITQDENMMQAYRNGEDLHSYTASLIFGKPIADIDPKTERYPSKTVNFMIFYGATARALQTNLKEGGLDWTETECESMIREWFKAYPGIEKWVMQTTAFIRRHGYTVDMYGRRRWLDKVFSPRRFEREAAIREGTNMPLQSSAQGILKKAMGNLNPVCRAYTKAGKTWLPLIQIHDELLFEVAEDYLDEIVQVTQQVMNEAETLTVPLESDAEIGRDWGNMVDYTKWGE